MLQNDREKFLKQVFGAGSFDSRHINFIARCPNPKCGSHLKGKLKFAIKLDSFFTNCWLCGEKHKSLYPVLKKYFPQHLKEYIEKFSDRKDYIFDDDEKPEEKKVELPQKYIFLPEHINSKDPDIRRAILYLKNRGLTIKDFWRYNILYCDNDPIFSKMVIFPSFDAEGNLNYFVGRKIDKNSYIKYKKCDYPTNKIIFNEYMIDFSKEVIITEGVFDAIKAGENAIPLLGSSISVNSLLFYQIVKSNSPVLMALDKDAQEKTQKIAKLLDYYNIKVKILEFEDYNDLGEMPKNHFAKIRHSARKFSQEENLLRKIQSL